MLNILTVDDDEISLIQVGQMLAELGTNTQARGGVEALALVEESIVNKKKRYDLILMDVLMPGMDGLKTVSGIVRLFNEHKVPLEKRPKIVMLSSVDERETQIDALYACGADHYLTKPVDDKTLKGALADLGLLKPGE